MTGAAILLDAVLADQMRLAVLLVIASAHILNVVVLAVSRDKRVSKGPVVHPIVLTGAAVAMVAVATALIIAQTLDRFATLEVALVRVLAHHKHARKCRRNAATGTMDVALC